MKRRHKIELRVERLESRDCPAAPVVFTLIDSTTLEVGSYGPYVSINNAGLVGYVERYKAGVYGFPYQPGDLAFASDGTQIYSLDYPLAGSPEGPSVRVLKGPAIQVADGATAGVGPPNAVKRILSDTLFDFSLGQYPPVETVPREQQLGFNDPDYNYYYASAGNERAYKPYGPYRDYTGTLLPYRAEYKSISAFTGLNNNGQSFFSATDGTDNVVLATRMPGAASATVIQTFASGTQLRPMISDDGRVVYLDPQAGDLVEWRSGSRTVIAASQNGFSQLGMAPGVSDDGRAVAFYGVLSAQGAAELSTAQPGLTPLTPGAGLFVSVAQPGFPRQIVRVAGLSGNGRLDPGETLARPGDPSSDQGLFTGFDPDARVGVQFIPSINSGSVGGKARLAFLAKGAGGVAVVASAEVDYAAATDPATGAVSLVGGTATPNIVATAGETLIPGLGMADRFGIYDPINTAGQVAFWAANATGQAVVRADQPQVDLDIDSDNTNELGLPNRSAAEEAIEDDATNGRTGKRVLATVADLDASGTGAPDYAVDLDHDGVPDFIDFLGIKSATADYHFTPLVVELSPTIDPATAMVRFRYSASDPAGYTYVTVTETWPGFESRDVPKPALGHLRIWRKDAQELRIAAGDYLGDGVAVLASALGLSASNRSVTLYLEGITPSASPADQQIRMEVDPDGDGPIGFTLGDAVRVTVTPGERPTFTGPTTVHIAQGKVPGTTRPNGWSANVFVSKDDGLVAQDIYLGDRYMAESFSLPYVVADNSVGHWGRVELLRPDTPDAAPGAVRSRLVDFYVTDDQTAIEAVYVIDRRPAPSTDQPAGDEITTILVTQRYEFRPLKDGELGEPVGAYPLARYFPSVSYQYFGQSADSLQVFKAPQRLLFNVDGTSPNVATLFKDTGLGLPPAEPVPANPLPREEEFDAIALGFAGVIDNFHQSYYPEVEPPEAIPPQPGAPEGIHMHWKWSTAAAAVAAARVALLGGSDRQFNGGSPIIPMGSTQTVQVGVVKAKASEEDPTSFRDLLNDEPIGSADGTGSGDVVLWYEGSNNQTHDSFFTHGGFFVPQLDRYVNPLVSVTTTTRTEESNLLTKTVKLTLAIKNESRSIIPGPIRLIIDSRGTLKDVVDGFTESGNLPYVKVDVGAANVFAPGDVATVSITLKGVFAGEPDPIYYHVYSGPNPPFPEHFGQLAPFTGDPGGPTTSQPPALNASTPAGTPVVIRVFGSGPIGDLDPMTVAVVSGPAHGTVSIDPLNGDVTYTPAAGYAGPDSFDYTVKDSAGNTSNAATVSLTVLFHAIDAVAPSSSVASLPLFVAGPSFLVAWAGTDDTGGSGVATYDVYVSDDGGPFTPFLLGTITTSATFTGSVGHRYAFYSVATDYAGNVQSTPSTAQATTTIVPPPPARPAPVVTLAAPTVLGTTFHDTGSFTSQGTGPFVAAVDYGDKTGLKLLTVSPSRTFTLSHSYAHPGTYTVTVGVKGGTGAVGHKTLTLKVTSAPPPVVPPTSGYGAGRDAFVSSLYSEGLGRLPEPKGLRYWSGLLYAGAKPTTVARAIYTTPERKALLAHGLVTPIPFNKTYADALLAGRKAARSNAVPPAGPLARQVHARGLPIFRKIM